MYFNLLDNKKKGRDFIRLYKKDFLALKKYLKTEKALITGSEQNPLESIDRSHLTREVNFFLKRFHTETTKYRSHSFRKTHITDLWAKTSDIELVRQSIGHRNIATTSSYIHDLESDVLFQKLEKLDNKDESVSI